MANEELIICGATFGKGEIKKDITTRLIKDIKDNKINKRYSYKSLGDPVPGVQKEVKVIFKSGGKIFTKSFLERSTPDKEIMVIIP